MVNNSNELMKQISNDWANVLSPNMGKYSPKKFFKIMGPILIGIELDFSMHSQSYEPNFVAYGLWGYGKSRKISTNPFIFLNYRMIGGITFRINYSKHNYEYPAFLELIKEKTPILFEPAISFTEILNFLQKDYPIMAKIPTVGAYSMGYLYESILKFVLYEKPDEALKILENIKMIKWDQKTFDLFGVNVGNWILSLENMLKERYAFSEIVSLNINNKKLSKLPNIKITL